MITLQEKIEVIELLIEEYEEMPFRSDLLPRQLSVLKAVAKDLRARLDGAPSVTETELGRRINAVQMAKEFKAGNLKQRLMALGQETLVRWPVISQALERFADEPEVANMEKRDRGPPPLSRRPSPSER
jgi:hypothetical protein